MKKNKGITLIALIITIIVLLILSGIALNALFNENGIIKNVQETVIKAKLEAAKEEISIEAANLILKYNMTIEAKGTVQEYVTSNISSKYNKQEISGVEVTVSGTNIILEYSEKQVEGYIDTSGDVIWEEGYSKVVSKLGDIEPEASTYKKIGDVYVNTPDLSNLNPEATYYVTYDEDGNNPTIYGRIDRVEAPEDWYNYAEKKWANIVTVTNNEVAYWVWIPRYKYITDSTTKTVDVKFVSTNNTYLNGEGAEETLSEEYQLSEAFTFNEQELAGYWMSKYEVSESGDEEPVISIGVSTLTITTNAVTDDNYTIFIDGEKTYTGSLPYVMEAEEGREYDICITKGGTMIGRYVETLTTQTIQVDLSNLNPECTYYVYWDEDGTEHNDIPISESAPENWYNYAEKKWANIVTKGEDGKVIAYWVWIPRYAYKINPNLETVSVKFVNTENKYLNGAGEWESLSEEYEVSDAFTFNGVELAGYWISKYEVSESSE